MNYGRRKSQVARKVRLLLAAIVGAANDSYSTQAQCQYGASYPAYVALARLNVGNCLPCKALECQNQTSLVTSEALLDVRQLFPIENPFELLGV